MDIFEFEHHRTVTDRVVNAGLRIGPLILMDIVMDGSCFKNLFIIDKVISTPIEVSIPSAFYISLLMMYFSATFLALLLSLLLFILSLRQLKHIYLYVTSCMLVVIAITINFYTDDIHTYLESTSTLRNLLVTIAIVLTQHLCIKICLFLRRQIATVSQTFIGWVIEERLLYACILVPPVLGFTSNFIFALTSSVVVVIVLIETYVFIRLFSLHSYVDYSRRWLQEFGLQSFITYHWHRVDAANVLRLFWSLRIGLSLYMYSSITDVDLELYVPTNNEATSWPIVLRYVLINCCDNLVSLLALACVISKVMNEIGNLITVLLGTQHHEDQYIGMISGVLFFILGLQTGLTSLPPSMRIMRLYRNFYLLVASTLHYIHSMMDTVLNAVSASHNANWKRHCRPLVTCACLVATALWLMTHLWSKHSLSSWLLAVTAFSAEVIIKVVVSLTVYSLFMIDAYRSTFWEKLDDYVYYVKSVGNTIEFFFAIFVFCNGSWIMLFESGGSVRAFMMCIHAYFNIWLQAKKGWSVFIKRRTAVARMSRMETASHEQLTLHNDVCPICFSPLSSAVIAKCNHYFHSVCLRKWLYVQDACPICRKNVHTDAQ